MKRHQLSGVLTPPPLNFLNLDIHQIHSQNFIFHSFLNFNGMEHTVFRWSWYCFHSYTCMAMWRWSWYCFHSYTGMAMRRWATSRPTPPWCLMWSLRRSVRGRVHCGPDRKRILKVVTEHLTHRIGPRGIVTCLRSLGGVWRGASVEL